MCESFCIAIFCKSLTNGLVFVRRSIWISTLARTLFHMCQSGQCKPNPTRVIPLRSVGMDVRRTSSIWKIIMNSHDIEMENIYNVFLKIKKLISYPVCQTCSILGPKKLHFNMGKIIDELMRFFEKILPPV